MIRLGFAIDPGPTRSGAALVELREDGWVHIVWGGHVESAGAELRQHMRSAARVGAIVAIEHLHGYAYQAKRVAQLLETAQAEGEIRGRAEQNWVEAAADPMCAAHALVVAGALPSPRAIEAVDWRGELCRSKTASDEQIRVVVEGICPVRPTLKADARPHVYDAAGLAIVALARANNRRIELPASVNRALHLQQEAEKAKRAERKAAGLPAVDATKRSATRAQSARRSEAARRGWAERKAGA